MPTPSTPSPVRRRPFTITAAVIAVLVAGLAVSPRAHADANPHQRGPAPTLAALQAAAGPFAVEETVVARADATGFAGATIYAPAGAATTFGGIAVVPGFTAPRSTMAWLAARTASHGFVVINIDTLARTDNPARRGRQLLAALDYLTTRSAVRERVDPTRLAVMGHSMGGGGSIEAADARPSLQAAVPLTPWHTTKSWPRLRVPTLVVGAELDTTARPADHAEPLYRGMSAAPDKAYLELAGAGHRVPITVDTTIGTYGVAWLKRFVDDDLRYEQFLCPAPAAGGPIGEYRATCPHA